MTKHLKSCTCGKCSLCGCMHYETFTFKKGYVCENCLEFLKDRVQLPDSLDSL